MRALNRFIGLLFWICLAASQAAHGATPSLTDAQASAVRSVVQAQLAAFAVDDAVRAFSFASPGIRTQFRTAENFMSMVRAAYPMVYRPASVAFEKPELRQEIAIQRVHMTDLQGDPWLAIYRLNKAGKTWRILGCVVVPVSAQTT